ncbi:zinc finger protein 260-like [Culex pipiens pallens]|uniref:zinc finger protein 260-like n=1 Tax=Culex pipiens pallens TaxID=42434 RepID=UPI001954D734|nr:zinc finger protein 260-like [Culex pipiens pallens]
MERPKREDFDKICRLCLKSASLVNIFDRNPKTQQESLSTLVRETVEMLGLTIDPDDNFPRKMCLPCKDSLRSLYKFRNQCQEANDLILEVLSSFELTVAKEAPSILTVSVPEVQPKLSEEFISVKATSTLINEDIPAIDDHDEPFELTEQMVLEADSSSALNVSIAKSEVSSTVTVSLEYEYLEQESEPDDGERDGKVEEMEANAGQDVYTIEMQADEAEEVREDGGGDVQNSEVYPEEPPAQAKTPVVLIWDCMVNRKPAKKIAVCDKCGKYFKGRTLLANHKSVVHADRERKTFNCPYCSMQFATWHNRHRHISTHTGKRYKCSRCSKTFTDRKSKYRHENEHDGPQFACSKCGKKFMQKCYQQRHTKKCTGRKNLDKKRSTSGSRKRKRPVDV